MNTIIYLAELDAPNGVVHRMAFTTPAMAWSWIEEEIAKGAAQGRQLGPGRMHYVTLLDGH